MLLFGGCACYVSASELKRDSLEMTDNSNSTVYVIDDDRAVLRSLILLLTAEGYAVRVHESARTFLDMIDKTTAVAW